MFFSPNVLLLDNDTLWQTFLRSDIKDYASFKTTLATQPEQLKLELEALSVYLQSQAPQDPFEWHLFDFLCVLGAIFAFCSGFDGMVSVVFVVFPQLFVGLAIVLGVISAICALGIFLARDRLSIAEALGLDIETTTDKVDQYLFKIQKFYHHHSIQKLASRDRSNLQDLIDEYQVLTELLNHKQVLNSRRMQDIDVNLQSNIVLLIGAIILFSDGFFVGQSVGLFFANFLMSNPFILTLITGVGIGLCGLACYLYVERPSLNKFLYGVLFTNQVETELRLAETQDDVRHLGFGLAV